MTLETLLDRLSGKFISLVAWTAVGTCALCLVVGCGGGNPCSVGGQVTFDGQPIEDGNIRLDPIEESLGASGAAKITGGKYSIPQDKGMLAGKHQVRISATRSTGRMVPVAEVLEGEPQEMREEIIQYIPARYNQESELTVELAPGENTKDFDLQSDK